MTDADAVRRAYEELADDYDRIYPDWHASSAARATRFTPC